MNSNTNSCAVHNITYMCSEKYESHKKECDDLLKPNICLFNIASGTACKAIFKETGSLIIHYFYKHQRYACSRCLSDFSTLEELENHDHASEPNLRLRKHEMFN